MTRSLYTFSQQPHTIRAKEHSKKVQKNRSLKGLDEQGIEPWTTPKYARSQDHTMLREYYTTKPFARKHQLNASKLDEQGIEPWTTPKSRFIQEEKRC